MGLHASSPPPPASRAKKGTHTARALWLFARKGDEQSVTRSRWTDYGSSRLTEEVKHIWHASVDARECVASATKELAKDRPQEVASMRDHRRGNCAVKARVEQSRARAAAKFSTNSTVPGLHRPPVSEATTTRRHRCKGALYTSLLRPPVLLCTRGRPPQPLQDEACQWQGPSQSVANCQFSSVKSGRSDARPSTALSLLAETATFMSTRVALQRTDAPASLHTLASVRSGARSRVHNLPGAPSNPKRRSARIWLLSRAMPLASVPRPTRGTYLNRCEAQVWWGQPQTTCKNRCQSGTADEPDAMDTIGATLRTP